LFLGRKRGFRLNQERTAREITPRIARDSGEEDKTSRNLNNIEGPKINSGKVLSKKDT